MSRPVVNTHETVWAANVRATIFEFRLNEEQAHKTLQQLYLNENSIGDEGASALADALKATLVMRTARSSLRSHLRRSLLHPGSRCSEKHVPENVLLSATCVRSVLFAVSVRNRTARCHAGMSSATPCSL